MAQVVVQRRTPSLRGRLIARGAKDRPTTSSIRRSLRTWWKRVVAKVKNRSSCPSMLVISCRKVVVMAYQAVSKITPCRLMPRNDPNSRCKRTQSKVLQALNPKASKPSSLRPYLSHWLKQYLTIMTQPIQSHQVIQDRKVKMPLKQKASSLISKIWWNFSKKTLPHSSRMMMKIFIIWKTGSNSSRSSRMIAAQSTPSLS